MIQIEPTRDMVAALRRLEAVEIFAIGGATVAEMTAGCTVLDVSEHGQIVGTLALELVGDVARITAAASWGKHTAQELAMIESIAKGLGAKHLEFCTRRPGLIRRALSSGYQIIDATVSREL